jgi:hypothetical protein
MQSAARFCLAAAVGGLPEFPKLDAKRALSRPLAIG